MILQEPFAIPPPGARIYVRTLTIDHTQVPSTQSNFPILVNFTDNTFRTVANGGHVKATNAFTFSSDSAGTSLLKWEVDRYNATTGEIVAWVKIVSVSSSSDTVFYLRYGGSITTDQSDAVNVWTNNFRAVWHLKDGSSLTLTDSAGGGFTLTNNNTVTAATGQIDGAANFASASSQYLSNATVGIGTAVTFSAWFKATTFAQDSAGVMTMRGATGYCLIDIASGTPKCQMFVKATTDISYSIGTNLLSTGTWYYIVLTYDSSAGLNGYVNAASDHATVAANGNVNTDPTTINIGRDSFGTRYSNGVIDEPRIANVARSADWITVEYANQKPSANLVALGSET